MLFMITIYIKRVIIISRLYVFGTIYPTCMAHALDVEPCPAAFIKPKMCHTFEAKACHNDKVVRTYETRP